MFLYTPHDHYFKDILKVIYVKHEISMSRKQSRNRLDGSVFIHDENSYNIAWRSIWNRVGITSWDIFSVFLRSNLAKTKKMYNQCHQYNPVCKPCKILFLTYLLKYFYNTIYLWSDDFQLLIAILFACYYCTSWNDGFDWMLNISNDNGW